MEESECTKSGAAPRQSTVKKIRKVSSKDFEQLQSRESRN